MNEGQVRRACPFCLCCLWRRDPSASHVHSMPDTGACHKPPITPHSLRSQTKTRAMRRFEMDKQSRRSVAHAVVIAGGGPTGLMLAAELALARVDVALVERRADQNLEGMRAGGLHMRTLEVLDQRGIAERFISQGQKHPMVPFA